jgi:hypothetical protein
MRSAEHLECNNRSPTLPVTDNFPDFQVFLLSREETVFIIIIISCLNLFSMLYLEPGDCINCT